METSIFLAKVIGLFGAISTIAIIIRYRLHLAIEEDAVKSPTLVVLSGFIFLMLGIILTVGHQVWAPDWRIVITILGWMVLAKGIMRTLFPETVKKMIERKKSDKRFFLGEVFAFFISIYLMYHGFFTKQVIIYYAP